MEQRLRTDTGDICHIEHTYSNSYSMSLLFLTLIHKVRKFWTRKAQLPIYYGIIMHLSEVSVLKVLLHAFRWCGGDIWNIKFA